MAVDSYSSPNPAPAETVCSRCESSMPTGAAFCPGCGRSMKSLTSAERLAAAGAYFTLVPAAVFLFLPAFRKSGFVRFHAWQSILLWVVFLGASETGILVSNIAAAALLLLLGIWGSVGLVFFLAVLSFQVWQGVRFEVPLVGFVGE